VCPVAPRSEKTLLYVFVGKPGGGKSHQARALAAEYGEIYYKPADKWWDGYKQQPAVVMDDFYGWIQNYELLRIADKYPHKVEIKGGFEEFTSKIIIITSNAYISDWYKHDRYDPTAVYRRCEKYQWCEERVFSDMVDIKINY
jgi:hypothetical protein